MLKTLGLALLIVVFLTSCVIDKVANKSGIMAVKMGNAIQETYGTAKSEPAQKQETAREFRSAKPLQKEAERKEEVTPIKDGTIAVVLKKARVRSNPTLSSPVLKTLSVGEQVPALAISNGWTKVLYLEGESEEEGWIKSNLLKLK